MVAAATAPFPAIRRMTCQKANIRAALSRVTMPLRPSRLRLAVTTGLILKTFSLEEARPPKAIARDNTSVVRPPSRDAKGDVTDTVPVVSVKARDVIRPSRPYRPFQRL